MGEYLKWKLHGKHETVYGVAIAPYQSPPTRYGTPSTLYAITEDEDGQFLLIGHMQRVIG